MFRPLPYCYILFACTAGAAVLGDRVLRRAPSAPPKSEVMSGPTFEGQRLAAKVRIGEEAAAGRLSLLQAAAALKNLDDAGARVPVALTHNRRAKRVAGRGLLSDGDSFPSARGFRRYGRRPGPSLAKGTRPAAEGWVAALA